MKLDEVNVVTTGKLLDKTVNQKMAKVRKAFLTELKRFDKSAKIQEEVIDPFKARIFSELNKFMYEQDMEQMWKDLHDAVKHADVNGHIHAIDEFGTGTEFVSAILTGLRPGMKVKAEAFFPTVGFDITWKQVVHTRQR